MEQNRVDLFIKKLRVLNRPKSYKGNAIVDKFGERKTKELFNRFHTNGVDVKKYLEYSLFDIDHAWRYNVIMHALDFNYISPKEIKYFIAIDDFVAGMMHEHPSVYEKMQGSKKVSQYEKLNVDKYVRQLLVMATEAEIYKDYEKEAVEFYASLEGVDCKTIKPEPKNVATASTENTLNIDESGNESADIN